MAAEVSVVVTGISGTAEGISLVVVAVALASIAPSLGDSFYLAPAAFAMMDLVTVADTTVVLVA